MRSALRACWIVAALLTLAAGVELPDVVASCATPGIDRGDACDRQQPHAIRQDRPSDPRISHQAAPGVLPVGAIVVNVPARAPLENHVDLAGGSIRFALAHSPRGPPAAVSLG